MKKVGLLTDVNSGFTPKEAAELGIRMIEMPFMIDGETWTDSRMTQEGFWSAVAAAKTVSTSQPSPADTMELWDEMLSEYDEIVYMPLTSGLSNTTQTAQALAQDEAYEGRVFVVDNCKVSITQEQACRDALALIDLGYSAGEIRDILERDADNNMIYIAMDTLSFLKKGGRLTPAAAAIGTALRIKPILKIGHGGRLDVHKASRTIVKSKAMMIESIRRDLEERFGDPDAQNCHFAIAYSNSYPEATAQAEDFANQLAAAFPLRAEKEINVKPLALPLCCHIGPGGMGVAVYMKTPELADAKGARKSA